MVWIGKAQFTPLNITIPLTFALFHHCQLDHETNALYCSAECLGASLGRGQNSSTQSTIV